MEESEFEEAEGNLTDLVSTSSARRQMLNWKRKKNWKRRPSRIVRRIMVFCICQILIDTIFY